MRSERLENMSYYRLLYRKTQKYAFPSCGKSFPNIFRLLQRALHRILDSAKQQYDTLSNLIVQFGLNDNQAHSQLRDTVLQMRDAGEGLWEGVRARAQEQIDLSANAARQAMNDQVREMHYLVCWMDPSFWFLCSDLMCLQMENLLQSASEKVFPPPMATASSGIAESHIL
ncbi:hypothetical protein QFC19_007864 [Naganishia cerealis]|uniref:Uncharacterized protein n=1 Tax=Naganishia cerealis TaxID=610337 RepID=A0ACC2V768_9TREE|nr:hypothetical protein QFC19_007864 [Naganishia cerealis]